jgi:5-methylcytosine-specific restriction endonuclease McrA
VIDEIKPISRWREFGYPSPQAAAQDIDNLQAAHYCCNAAKSDGRIRTRPLIILDGEW